MLQRNGRDKENICAYAYVCVRVCVCACVCVCMRAFISIRLNYLWKEHENFTKTRCLRGEELGNQGARTTFLAKINFALLLNFEPSKYIAIKKGQEKKPLQGCSLRLSRLEKYPRRLWRECL